MTYFRLVAAVAVFLLIVGAFFYGQSVGRDRQAAATQKSLDRIAAARDKLLVAAQARDAEAAAADVERQTIVREITREVPRIIDRPVYRNVCVDADGVRLIDRAVDAANGVGAAGGRTAGGAGSIQSPSGDRGG